ncbi:MAG: hypothetical protein K5917_00420 [Clostridiales bacterium]|nr:hypothetical protein [Clostridiales bacterium]
MVISLIKKYGREISVHTPDGWNSKNYKALIQPLRYKNKMYLEGVHTPIGVSHDGYYLYIGVPENDITKLPENSYLRCSDEYYKIDTAEKVFVADKNLYIWAILRSLEGDCVEEN